MPKRTIVHSQEYAEAYDDLKMVFPRLPDVQAGIEWGLHNNAEQFPAVPEVPEYRFVFTDPVEGEQPIPAFSILARVDIDDVELIAIERLFERRSR